MRLGIVTALWKRPELTKLVLNYYGNLRMPGVDLDPIAVWSPEDPDITEMSLAHIAALNWCYLVHPNRPLGKKWNAGLQAFRNRDVDAVIIIGSDDLLSREYFEWIIPQIRGGIDYITIRDLYVFDALKQRLVYAHSALSGAGRVISRRVLDALDWTLWEDAAEYGLDGSMGHRLHQPIKQFGTGLKSHHVRNMLTQDFAMVDIKTDINMWHLDGKTLCGKDGRELAYRKVTELNPAAFFERYFPNQSARLLNWAMSET